jgi:hypothetical protein
MRPRGDGCTDVHARIPDHVAGRLRAYLNAYTAPRRRHLQDTVETPFGPLTPPAEDEFANLPLPRQRGEAFVALLENIPTKSLPRHGGTATSVMVILDYDTLLAETGVAQTSTGEPITAGQARRLACQADIIPVVLGGKSEILDVGHLKRLVTDVIRKALNLRDRGCTEVGCSMPAEFCEVGFPGSDGHRHSGRSDHGEVSTWRPTRRSSKTRSSRCTAGAARSWSWPRSSTWHPRRSPTG